jgi:hypothetical protein
MNKRVLSVVLAMAMIVLSLASVLSLQAAADADVVISIASTADYGKGEIVEIPVSISENSYLVNADMQVTYDPTQLELVQDAYADPDDESATICYQMNDSLFRNFLAEGTLSSPGVFKFACATGNDKGITKGGEMFRLKFKILVDDVESTQINFSAQPICSNDGTGELDASGRPIDSDITYTVEGGVITIKDANPTTTTVPTTPPVQLENFLQEAYITAGRDNITINSDGSWTATGNFTLTPNYTYDYTEMCYLLQSFVSDVKYKVIIIDTDPEGVYGTHTINLYDNWVGPEYFPAGEYNKADGINGIYNWNITNSGWRNSRNTATVTQIKIELGGTGTLTLKGLALSDDPNVELPITTTTTTTTTTTAAPVVTKGDLDGNGSVNMSDAMALYQAVSGQIGLTMEQAAAADMDGDGAVNMSDAMALYLIVSGAA